MAADLGMMFPMGRAEALLAELLTIPEVQSASRVLAVGAASDLSARFLLTGFGHHRSITICDINNLPDTPFEPVTFDLVLVSEVQPYEITVKGMAAEFFPTVAPGGLFAFSCAYDPSREEFAALGQQISSPAIEAVIAGLPAEVIHHRGPPPIGKRGYSLTLGRVRRSG